MHGAPAGSPAARPSRAATASAPRRPRSRARRSRSGRSRARRRRSRPARARRQPGEARAADQHVGALVEGVCARAAQRGAAGHRRTAARIAAAGATRARRCGGRARRSRSPRPGRASARRRRSQPDADRIDGRRGGDRGLGGGEQRARGRPRRSARVTRASPAGAGSSRAKRSRRRQVDAVQLAVLPDVADEVRQLERQPEPPEVGVDALGHAEQRAMIRPTEPAEPSM